MTGRALRLAHRGDRRHAPENTVGALRAAAGIPGCDGVEFDVRLSGDGVPVLLHDETLARVQRRPERVAALTAAELGRLGVPTLAEALDAVRPPAFVDAEVKGDPGGGIGAVVDALETARGTGLDDAVISAFEPAVLERLATLRPSWPRWLNADDLSPATIARAVALGCSAISVRWPAINPATARRVSAAGLGLAAWTVRRRATARLLERLGVVAVCVEGPALDG